MKRTVGLAVIVLLASRPIDVRGEVGRDLSFAAFLPKWESAQSRFINGDPSFWKQNTSHGDTGTFHDFDAEQQQGMARSVDALATDDATVILLCWPRRIRPLIRGVSREEIEAAFAGWKITDVEPSFFKLPRPLEWVLRPDEHWYRLRRA